MRSDELRRNRSEALNSLTASLKTGALNAAHERVTIDIPRENNTASQSQASLLKIAASSNIQPASETADRSQADRGQGDAERGSISSKKSRSVISTLPASVIVLCFYRYCGCLKDSYFKSVVAALE